MLPYPGFTRMLGVQILVPRFVQHPLSHFVSLSAVSVPRAQPNISRQESCLHCFLIPVLGTVPHPKPGLNKHLLDEKKRTRQQYYDS